MQWYVLLECRAEHEVHPRLRQVAGLRVLGDEDADELDLPEATAIADDRRRGCLLEGLLGEVYLHRRAAGVTDDDGPVALPAGPVGELPPVGILPPLDHQHVVVPQVGPVIQVGVVARLAKVAHRRQQEGQPRRRRSGVLHHCQPPVLRFHQVLQVGGRCQVLLGEPALVVVEAHIAIVHRQGAVLGVEFQVVGNLGQERRIVGLQDAGFQRPAEEGAIHAIEDVGQGIVGAKDGLVEDHARVPGLENLDLGVVLRLESDQSLLADVETVVGHNPQRTGLGRCSRRRNLRWSDWARPTGHQGQ